MSQSYDAIVVGGGSAGTTCASFLARYGWRILLIDKGIKYGFLGSFGDVSFIPGFVTKVNGSEIIGSHHQQAEKFGTTIKTVTVDAVEFDGPIKKVKSGAETWQSRTVVLATGAAERTSHLNGELEFFGRGVFHDASLFGPCAAGQHVAVIGKNKLAAEETLELAKVAEQISFLIPSNRLDIDGRLLSQLQHDKKIELLFSTSIKTINGNDKVKSITVFSSGNEKEIFVSTVFTYIHDIQMMNQFLKGLLEMTPSGAIMVGEQMETSVHGVFACGDILCAKPQIPTISIAQGIIAGMNVHQFLSSKV